MSKYLYLFRGGDARETLSPEQMQAHMQKWISWMKGLSEQGTLIDGLPLSTDGKMVTDRGGMVTDGPYAEGKEVVAGYLMINANSLDEAVHISKGCPILEEGGTIEVRQIEDMPTQE